MINNLLNKDYILDIIETDGKAFTRPWFGQLMTGPQLMAYLCQVNMWLEKYNPKIEIFHNEDSATNAITKSNRKKEIFVCKNQIKSIKVILSEMKENC